jgi:hypothetical protein
MNIQIAKKIKKISTIVKNHVAYKLVVLLLMMLDFSINAGILRELYQKLMLIVRLNSIVQFLKIPVKEIFVFYAVV